jgi:hypothetical protein
MSLHDWAHSLSIAPSPRILSFRQSATNFGVTSGDQLSLGRDLRLHHLLHLVTQGPALHRIIFGRLRVTCLLIDRLIAQELIQPIL